MNDDVTTLLTQLVSVESINPDLVPGGAGEGQIARFIANWCQVRGLEVNFDEVRPGRPNVIAIAKGQGAGKTLLFNGHTDTVGVAGMTSPHQPVVAHGRLYGRGAYDMKAGLAACMLALDRAHRRNLRGDVILSAVMDEEFAGEGTLDVARRYRADAAIVAEPTEMALVIAHKGFVWFDIETTGVAAHGSRPDLGVDAITKMGRVLIELEALNMRLLARPTHPLLKSGSLHASLISGGQERSSYPERCVLQIERRTIPGETPDSTEAELRAIIERLKQVDPHLRCVVRCGLHRAPMETREDAPVPALIKHHAANVTGRLPAITGAPYWTDAASLAEAGIPAVLFGPRGAGAHATEEWVDLESVHQCAEIYERVAAAFCA